ncbi:MAG: fibronectin type III domain-containing protein, partial [Actinomycetota bacterium]|nr:fibronectin type III domain-containing protein [Actinomycetota bacterium]
VRAYPAQTGVGVFWDPAVDGGRPITHYALLAVDRATQVPMAFAAVPSDVRQLTFSNLPTNRRYDVLVAAFDGSAWGALASASAVDAIPYGDTVPDEPRFVAAYASGDDALVVFGPSWHDRGQPIDLYSVIVVDAAGTILRWINTGPTDRYAYLADLPTGRTLSVYVAAHTPAGFSTGGRPANLRL